MTTLINTPETKSAAFDPAQDDLRYSFESYRLANDERLAEIESRGAADPLLDEKVARIDAALDETKRRIDRVALDRARPALGQDGPRDPLSHEHKAAFAAYIRSGEAGG